MRKFKIVVEYEGTAYHGWQRQDGRPTVQHVLEDAIGRITQEKITLIGSGRTDAGVHALHQSAHFQTGSILDVRSLHRGINSLLPQDIVVKEITEIDEQFHARFDVKSKVYMYQILNAPIRSAHYRRFVWHISVPLDTGSMEQGLAILKGAHDFSSFCGKKDGDRNCVRTITAARLEQADAGLLRIYLEADGFLRYMVRTIVGTLVEVGKGKRDLGELLEILEARERKRAGMTAPPRGLFLVNVTY